MKKQIEQQLQGKVFNLLIAKFSSQLDTDLITGIDNRINLDTWYELGTQLYIQLREQAFKGVG